MSQEVNFFYHHICHFCKIISSNIKICSGCKLVSYCSKYHQKKDWKDHKSFCSTVQEYLEGSNIKNLFDSVAEGADEWRRNRLSLMCILELRLKRPLKISERQMILFPNVCPVCHHFVTDKKFACSGCNYVQYCSLGHKDVHTPKHDSVCIPMKVCYEIDKLVYESKLGVTDLDVPYFNGGLFPQTMESYLFKYADSYDKLSQVVLSENISGVLSLSYVLNYWKYFGELDELVIHLIGASSFEQSVLMTIEYLFHIYLFLNKINVILIGPDVCDNYLLPILCKKCQHKTILTSKEKKLYHEYFKSKNFSKPNLIFSFNCGFSEFLDTGNNTWLQSFDCIWNYEKAFFAFTSYTESEAKLDFAVLMKSKPSHKNCSTDLRPNPYKSLRPYRNWEDFESVIFYNNNYITILELKI